MTQRNDTTPCSPRIRLSNKGRSMDQYNPTLTSWASQTSWPPMGPSSSQTHSPRKASEVCHKSKSTLKIHRREAMHQPVKSLIIPLSFQAKKILKRFTEFQWNSKPKTLSQENSCIIRLYYKFMPKILAVSRASKNTVGQKILKSPCQKNS